MCGGTYQNLSSLFISHQVVSAMHSKDLICISEISYFCSLTILFGVYLQSPFSRTSLKSPAYNFMFIYCRICHSNNFLRTGAGPGLSFTTTGLTLAQTSSGAMAHLDLLSALISAQHRKISWYLCVFQYFSQYFDMLFPDLPHLGDIS